MPFLFLCGNSLFLFLLLHYQFALSIGSHCFPLPVICYFFNRCDPVEKGLAEVERTTPPGKHRKSGMTPTSLKVYIETYGCQMNLYDSELVTRLLEDDDHSLADRLEEADILLVNTCAVREGAEQRVIGQLGHFKTLKEKRPHMIIGVLGCMSAHLSEKITARLPYVDLVMGPDQYRKLPGIIRDLLVSREKQYILTKRDKTENYDEIYPARKTGTNAWVTIMRGCDNMCTFCIVPFTRGRERSRSVGSIVEECHRLAEEGYREVTLLGQNVNSYFDPEASGLVGTDLSPEQMNGGATFPDLLRAVSEVKGIDRIRFTSPHPKDFSEAMISEMAQNPKVCKHMHLPMQAGNDRVLEKMRRDYTFDDFASLVDRAREAMPHIGFSTDIIVGFPTETEAEFEDTLRLVNRVQFDSAFTFEYSSRDGAPAAKWEDDVPAKQKNHRLQRLIEVQREILLSRAQACRGRQFEVLIESTSKKNDNEHMGRTTCNRVVVVPSDPRFGIGALVDVIVDDVQSFTLRGHVLRVEGEPIDQLDSEKNRWSPRRGGTQKN
jgi:tRNA-2-methylthio-N6-dimethylallyladenosine synthase